MSIRKITRTSQPHALSMGKEPGFFWSAANQPTKYGLAGAIYDSTNSLTIGSVPFVLSRVFTVVVVFAPATPSTVTGELLRIGGASDGIRLDVTTSAGGVNPVGWTANGVANLTAQVFSVASFSTAPMVAISSWTPTSASVWTGASAPYGGVSRPVQSFTQAVNMIAPSVRTVSIQGGPARNIYGIVVLPRAMTSKEALQVIDNPWQLFAPLQQPIFIPYVQIVAPTTPGYRPTSDVLTTGWTATPGPAFATSVDELSPDNADFITSSSVGLDPIIMGLNQNLPVGVWEVKVNASYTNGARQIRAVLLDGTNAVTGTSNWVSVPSISYTQLTLPVTTTALSSRIRIEVQ